MFLALESLLWMKSPRLFLGKNSIFRFKWFRKNKEEYKTSNCIQYNTTFVHQNRMKCSNKI